MGYVWEWRRIGRRQRANSTKARSTILSHGARFQGQKTKKK
jgi:hypothetical protein